jgi:hypothetical protein
LCNQGSLTSLNISNCKLTRGTCKEQFKPRTDEQDYYYETDFSGVIAVANAISDRKALSKLELRKNGLCSTAAEQVIADMLKNNSVLKYLDLSDNYGTSFEGKAGATALANGVADGLRDNGALSFLNVLKNQIPVKQAQELVETMQAKQKLANLCGLSKEETELDFSKQVLRTGDAVLIANAMKGMRAISRFKFGDKQTVTMTTDMIEADFSHKGLGVSGAIVVSAFLPTCT